MKSPAQTNFPAWNIKLIDNKLLQENIPYNDLTGYENNNNKYVFVGTKKNILAYEISDSLNLLFTIKTPDTVALHRDMKVYKNYLYCVASEGNSSLQIYDLSFLPDSVKLIYSSDSLVKNGRNIFIDTTMKFLFVASCRDGKLQEYGLRGFSLQNPTNPKPFWQDFYLNVSDGYSNNGITYLNCGTQGLWIFDFRDTANVKLIQSLEYYPNKGFCHSGTKEDSIYVFSEESINTGVKICSVNPDFSVQIESEVFSNNPPTSLPHSVWLRNGILFVSYYADGLQIFNARDVKNPFKIGYFDSFPKDTTFHYVGNWGVFAGYKDSNLVVISDRQNGLFLLNVSDCWKTVNIDSKKIDEIKIFPNPAGELLHYSPEDSEIKIYDLTGKLITRATKSPVNISSLPKGVYFLRTKEKTFKFVKN